MEGFILTFTKPAGVPGVAPVLVGLLPSSVWNNFGGVPVAMYSDYTVRNEAGSVLRDFKAEGKTLSIGGGLTSNDVARMPDGSPIPASYADIRDVNTSGGIAPGESPAESIYVAGKLPREAVYDDASNGGWGTPIRLDGPPSSQSRRDDRWFWIDGRITDAQGTVVGHWTGDRTKAIQEFVQFGSSALIVWDGSQVIAPPVTGSGGSSTVKATTESGFEVSPVTTDLTPNESQPIATGGASPVVLTSSSGSGGGGNSGGDGGGGGGGGGNGGGDGGAAPADALGFLQQTTLGLPNWAWLGAVVLVVVSQTTRKRR